MKNKTKILWLTIILFIFTLGFTGCEAGSLTEPTIKIKDINWSVKEGIADGKRRLVLDYTNNTRYPIASFKLTFREKEGLTEEQKNGFYSGIISKFSFGDQKPSDAEIAELKSRPISMHASSEQLVKSKETAQGIPVEYYEGFYYVDNSAHFELCEPDIATVVFIANDELHTVYYDFPNDTYTYDEHTAKAYDWTTGKLKDILPKPDAVVLENHGDSDTYFSFDVPGFTRKQYEQYVETCKAKGFTVDSKTYDDSYEAKNAEGYELDLYFYDPIDKNEMSVYLKAPEK